jgi:hypothetical protein
MDDGPRRARSPTARSPPCARATASSSSTAASAWRCSRTSSSAQF